ncbi:MAG: DUF1800 domain-containing protein [Bacteroidia bacterium]|nr:DUF1800 domain-containing protein [Bacteroidia bacterium]
MNRRSVLRKLVASTSSIAVETANTIAPYSGPWTYLEASHLLRRATFALNRDTLEDAVDNGLDFTLDLLFADKPLPEPPINYFFEEDPNVMVGETWITKRTGDGLNGYRHRSLRAWNFNLLRNEGIHLREKMTLFWHNHFVTESINDPRLRYLYITLLRNQGLGNFKTLTEAVTVDPAMLLYLNGHQNNKNAPNENYARELLELFTIGKGDLAGPGDYTNYTEDDVVALAKALTGWRVQGSNSDEIDEPFSYYDPNRHDTGEKLLSHRFDNVVISNSEENEYKEVIAIILGKTEVAKYICRKLYRYFVHHHISETIEQNIIEPLATIFMDNEWELKPVLQTLLTSEHFYSSEFFGTIITNPIEHIIKTLNITKIEIPQDDITTYEFHNNFHIKARNMQMEYFGPPNVAGWKVYYQAPAYYRNWISAVTLPLRMDFTDDLNLRRIRANEFDLSIDPLKIVDQIPTDISLDPNLLIQDLITVFYCQPMAQVQRDALKEILIPGLPDFEWTVEYGNYLDPNTTSEELKMAVRNKLKNLFRAMMTLPEYFVC